MAGDYMKKLFNHKNKIFRRLLCFTLVLALVLSGIPSDLVSDEVLERTGLVMNVKAEGELDALKEKYSGNIHNFTSGTADLSEYSQCFQDATWAASHANDTITLNPAAGSFVFNSDYYPIGNAGAPFSGTIYLNTSATDFAVDAYSAIFDYVSDSAKIYKMSTTTVIPLNINRLADAGDTISPLLARHVVGSGAETPYEWKVTLNSASAKSYSGVFHEMINGAKVNLTFLDDSSHAPHLDPNGDIDSGSVIDNKESGKNYGILCGAIKGSSILQCTYTKTNDDDVTFIGTGTAYCGGLVGELNNSTFELLTGSSNLKVDFQTPKNQVGFVCGHAEGSTITLPDGYSISGTIDGNVYAGGIAGYCKNTIVNYATSSGTIALSNCDINNGSDATATGGIFGYYECNNASNDILLTRTYSLTDCTVVSGKGYSGGIAGDYKPTYSSAATIDLDKYTLGSSISLSGTTAGGLFGRYTAGGSVTITDSNATNTHFAPPSSSAAYGGVIGEYANSSYSNTLALSNFIVNNLSCTSSGNVGGVVGMLNGSTYVSVSGVSVTNATADDTTSFGGIISTLNGSNAGSFIDLTGNFTLSMASGKTYKGGAIAGSFKKGVVRFAGVTDISGAKAENGYAQLVYENDETLVYAKGNGADANWTLKRNADTTASDLGQWGEVVRMFKVGNEYKNAEDAGIVSFGSNKVTIVSVTDDPAIADEVSFAKVALNMQLNDGSNHEALCFTSGGANKTALLSSDITVAGEINLSGTGLLGLMRDGGNDKYLKTDDNSFAGSPDFFTGSIFGTTGASTDKILLATGEIYGCDATGTALDSDSNGGKIYLSNKFGHDAQGLFAFAKGASVTNLEIGGSINVELKAGSDHLYAGALFGAMTNGATLSGVNVSTTINTTRPTNGKFYIGGVAGVFDGTDTTNSNGYTLTVDTSSSVKPTINLFGSIACESGYDKNSTFVGGVLGLLKGATATKYGVSISSSEVSPNINVNSDVTNTDLSYVGGMIGRVAKNTSNERSISLDTVTMTNANVDTKAKHAGGLLGAMWERTNLTVDGLTITGSSVNHEYSSSGSHQSGLVFMGTGKWDINTLSISNTSFSSTNTSPASFGLIVNQAYSGDDGLYINLLNKGYALATNVTVPTTAAFFDEIAADTKNDSKDGGDILVGGNGTGIVNINMNAASGTFTKIVDSETPANGTGTYQNQLYSQLGNLVANQNSRYYYNLDTMLAKGTKGSTAPGGEQFLLWSVYNYAASNIQSNFKADGDMITATNIDLSGLSYYPIPGGAVALPDNSTVTLGYNAIHDYENTSSSADSWKRFPDDTGAAKTTNARNQHYLMQTGLFTTVSSLSANTLTLAGDFGYVSGVASGALINNYTSGTVSLSGLTLNNLKPSSNDSYMLINHIDGTGDARPSLTLSNLRATNYGTTGVTVAKSLFGSAEGQNMTMNFSDIKLDARDGSDIADTNWTSTAAEAMTTAYGTSRSIFKTAIFFTELLAAKTSTLEYYYTVDEDWGSGSETRKVTYGKEVTDSREYNSGDGEKKYNIIGNGTRHYTNPISNSNTEFDFRVGFLPYVGNYTSNGTNATYPVNEIKVNYKVAGLVQGCGTYNDPYIISTASQFNLIADVVNNGAAPASIRLPNTMSVSSDLPFAATWHTGSDADSLYSLNQNTSKYIKEGSSSDSSWTSAFVRNYLASAYYVINTDLTGENSLPSTFEGIGKPGNAVNGNIVFHGVIVGKKSNGSAPAITNPSQNPLIYISNGSVVKNLDIEVTANISRSLARVGNNALYGYKPNDSTNKGAEYYGGVIGEIMGGDNIIDDVSVTYTGTTTLSNDTAKHLIAEGGMVGCVVNGALIFRGSNSVAGRSVTGGGIYSNPYVGRVINGYAIYEQIETRTGTAPDNYNKITKDAKNNEIKEYTYHIDTIDRSNKNKLDVDYSAKTITVPDKQSLYIMSLITQSIASTADDNYKYYKYSPSYGYNTDDGYKYINGVARLGDYSSVGCGTSATQPDDYSSYAILDSVNNYTNSSSKDGLMKAPVPYIIYRYTTRKSTTANNPAADFPARRMTFDNSRFWDITLSESDTFEDFDDFQAFRGIGCVGINAYKTDNNASKTAFKVATFDGGGNTISLHISLPRYETTQENYFHAQNKSLTQVYEGDALVKEYGHDNDANLIKLMGLGLFDCVMVKNDSTHQYQFNDFYLKGTIEDKVISTTGDVITGTTDNTQLFCVGGVYGKRIMGNNSDVNFKDITFDGLTITGAYSCGGLVGIDAVKNHTKMQIVGCNSTTNGINITGGYYGGSDNLRHGLGCFVGMTFWCRPCIDGKTNDNDTSDIYVSQVTSYYTGTKKRCNVGGLIGYSGTGAEIKNINLKGFGTNPAIGASTVYNAAGFIGFSQASEQKDDDYLQNSIWIENCTLNNLSVKARTSAAGFYGRSNQEAWGPRYIYILNSAVVGTGSTKPEIKAYGTGTTDADNIAGGFISGFFSTSSTYIGTIENSYVSGYKIQGYNVGGMVGRVSQKQMYLKNVYVKDCDIITHNTGGKVGGFVGYTEQNLSGYNLKIDNVSFKYNNADNTANAGIISGGNGSTDLTYKFVGICAYNSSATLVPTNVVKNHGAGTSNFFVFADYKNTSSADITAQAGHASMFGSTNTNNSTSNAAMPLAPYVNTAPHMGMGTDEYITSDGASIGKAGDIYKDIKAETSYYAIGSTAVEDSSVGNATDAATLAYYINDDGTYKSGAFKISTASAEFDTDFSGLAGVEDFAMLVINDDADKADEITPFIKSYIRLVTNAERSANTNKNSQYAYSNGNNVIDALYKVVVNPCYYDSEAKKFVLGTSGEQGLNIKSDGTYEFVSAKADSASEHKYQFSLIDVQFRDPTDSTKIAYHLYVPVYTKKMLSAEFSAVTMSATTYNRSPYADKITSEIAGGKNATGSNSILVESTNEWTTTFIRYTYPKNQIKESDNWNFDKSISLYLDGNFQTLPSGTELILVDPNGNTDKFYRLTLDRTYATGSFITLDLSSFKDENKNSFVPRNLSEIYSDPGASSTAAGHTNELYEDYYISMYVPMEAGKTHSVQVGSEGIVQMTHTNGSKANIVPKLYSLIILGDLFNHEITENSFIVASGDGSTWAADSREMTKANSFLRTEVTATVQIKNLSAGSYLANSNVYHAFYLTLTSHDENRNVSDTIYGTDSEYIHNSTTLSYTNSTGTYTDTSEHSLLGNNYIYLNTGSIRDALLDPTQTPTITIHSVTTMEFYDVAAFPFTANGAERVGTQVSISSNLAYREDELRFSSLKAIEEDPEGKFYYSTTKNSAKLSFNASPTDDTTDEIGLKTNNRSLLGVNGKYGTQHPVKGKAVYNVDDIIDYDRAENVVYTITLYKKVTDGDTTNYVQVNNIGEYLRNVNLTDSNGEVTLEPNRTDQKKYVYTGAIDHDNQLDLDKMFEVDFECTVLTGDSEHNEYANYKIVLTADLEGATNAWKDDYLVYTNAKFDPSVIDE